MKPHRDRNPDQAPAAGTRRPAHPWFRDAGFSVPWTAIPPKPINADAQDRPGQVDHGLTRRKNRFSSGISKVTSL